MRRRYTDSYGDLLRMARPIMTTREAAARLEMSTAAASQLLRRLEQSGLVHRLRRGLWAVRPDIEASVLAPFLTAPFPAYISFWSALARHGMIEQIPAQTYVASLDRSRRIVTSIGAFSIHHLAPELFGGYLQSGDGGQFATPEKALFDTVYLLSPGGGQIRLPELEVPPDFSRAELANWTARIPDRRMRTLVGRGLDRALAGAQLTAPAERRAVDLPTFAGGRLQHGADLDDHAALLDRVEGTD